MPKTHTPRSYLLIFAVSLGLHAVPLALALANPERAFTAGDSHDWDVLARNLAQHGVYSRSVEPPFTPDVFRAPLYPAFVAGVYALTNSSLPALLVAQAGLAAASAVLLYVLAGRLGLPPRTALLGAVLANVFPISSIFWATLASENLFVFLLLLALALAWKKDVTSLRDLSGLWAGLAAGLMVLVRPIGVLLLPGLALCAIWRRAPRQAALRLALACLGVAAAMGPWLWRNTRLYGQPAISTVGGVNLLTYNAAAVLARRAGLGFWEGRYLVWEYWDAYYAALDRKPANEVEDSQAMQAAAIEIILSNPLEFAWVNTVESLNSLRPGVAQLTVFWQAGVSNPPASEGDISPAAGNLGEPATRLITVLLVGFYGAAYLLSGVGGIAAAARRDWPVILALALPALVLLLSPGPVANSRFRVPAEPLLALLAAEGVRYVRARLGGVKRNS